MINPCGFISLFSQKLLFIFCSLFAIHVGIFFTTANAILFVSFFGNKQLSAICTTLYCIAITGTRVSTKAPTRRRRVAAQSLDGNAPVYNDIPQLAHGAVIPPNKEFLAVLGDQKSGTNIETPLATMVDAFKQAMAESGGGATTVVIQLDGKEIARSTVKNINNMTRAAGKPVLLY